VHGCAAVTGCLELLRERGGQEDGVLEEQVLAAGGATLSRAPEEEQVLQRRSSPGRTGLGRHPQFSGCTVRLATGDFFGMANQKSCWRSIYF
jgi:hypothetical protein